VVRGGGPLADDPRGRTGPLSVHDRRTGTGKHANATQDGTPAQYYAIDPSLSADGQYVAYAFRAPQGGGDTNGVSDGFVRRLR